jgi:hypothetical protein
MVSLFVWLSAVLTVFGAARMGNIHSSSCIHPRTLVTHRTEADGRGVRSRLLPNRYNVPVNILLQIRSWGAHCTILRPIRNRGRVLRLYW